MNIRSWPFLNVILAAVFWTTSPAALAGGGPQNILVVANENSRASLDVARYYMEKRGIPKRNLVLVRAPRNEENVSPAEFENRIAIPIRLYLEKTGLAPQIQFIVLCPDIPSRVNDNEGSPAVLFYGFKNSPGCPPCTVPDNTRNPYFLRERAFDWQALPADQEGTKRLVTMLRAGSIESLKRTIDRSVRSDASQPVGTFYLNKSADTHRNVRHLRYAEFDFHVRFFTNFPRVIYGSCSQRSDTLGFMDGAPAYPTNFWAQVGFLPGALADHMTSLAGRFPSTPSHDPCWKWLEAGSAGSYGTVNEPCNPLQKFPDPMVFFWYARGFNLAESYWMSVANPYQGVFLGDPLTAPYAVPPMVRWIAPTDGTTISGVVTLRWEAVAAARSKPCRIAELYVDDLYVATVTNIHPLPDTEITLTVAGLSFRYTVKPGDTLYDLAPGLELVIRQTPSAIRAGVFGDRLMLACMDPSIPFHRLDYRVEAVPPPGGAPVLSVMTLSPFFMRSVYPLGKLQGMEYPRGCILFSCGVPHLTLEYVWDTRSLSNGVYSLRAVVKDGTAVETQGHATLSLTVSNVMSTVAPRQRKWFGRME